jgi:hypothetical protein
VAATFFRFYGGVDTVDTDCDTVFAGCGGAIHLLNRETAHFPGAWLYSASHPVLHLNDISGTDQQQRLDSGVIDHIAFGSLGFEVMKQHLTGKGVRYRVNQVPSSTRWQIFFRDPNNVEIEL